MSGCGCEMQIRNENERRTLITVLCINAFMFLIEITTGIMAESTGLVADSLDMFADASVYAISLYAVGKSHLLKTKAARLSGYSQILLSFLVLSDVTMKFFLGSEPVSMIIMIIGLTALAANALCLIKIYRHRDSGVHMRASLIFSQNDVIANAGVIISGILVWSTGSRYPDLCIGLVIACLVFRGGIMIIKEADKEKGCSGKGLKINTQ